MVVLSYIVSLLSHLFIISDYFELFTISLYLVLIDPLYLVFFEEKDELIFLQLNIIGNMASQILIFSTRNVSSMLLSFFLYQLMKHFKILNNDKIIKFYKIIFSYTIWKKNEEEEYEEEMYTNIKVNHNLNDENEFTLLNSNTRKLGLVLTDVINIFAMIPLMGNKIMKVIYIEENEELLLNMQIFVMLKISSYILDMINYFIIVKSSLIKDGNFNRLIFILKVCTV